MAHEEEIVSAAASQLEAVGLGFRDKEPLRFGKELRSHFLFDESYINLNHGSFGTYPNEVRSELLKFQLAAEARPDQFIRYEYPKHLDASRLAVSKVLNTDVDNVVFVPNATMGVNTVLRSLRFEPGDKIIYFNFIYGACGKTVQYIEETTPAKGVEINIEFPCKAEELVKVFRDTILSSGGGLYVREGKVDAQRKPEESRVRIAIFDTIVSLPGLRLPFEELVKTCKELGVLSLVDAAHAIGHIPLDLTSLDPDFFVSNCHKWLFAPRGCAVFYVPKRNQSLVTSIPTSHGYIPFTRPSLHANVLPPPPTPKPLWVSMFEFVGTIDSSPYLCLPAAVNYREKVLGGEARITAYIQNIGHRGAQIIAEILGTEILDNEEGTLTKCALQNIRLPIGTNEEGRFVTTKEKEGTVKPFLVEAEKAGALTHYLQQAMIEEFNTFIPVILYRGNWYARISGQVYLDEDDFKFAGTVLQKLVEKIQNGVNF